MSLRPSPSTRAFFVKLVGFAALVLVADYGIAKVLDLGRPEDIRQFIEARENYDADTGYDVVILGSSHAADAFVPAVIETTLGLTAFNFGVYHAGPVETYFLALDLLRRGPKPRLVVLGFDPSFFLRSVDAGVYTPDLIVDPWLRLRLLRHSFDDDGLSVVLSAGRRRAYILPALKRLAGHPLATPRRVIAAVDNGYLMNLSNALPMSQEDSGEVDRVGTLSKRRGNPAMLTYLQETVEALRSAGVEVVLARPPVMLSRYDAMKDIVPVKQASAWTQALASDLKIPYFDSYDPSYLATYQTAEFLNEEHLCYAGAYRFTRDFVAWLAQQRPDLAYVPIDPAPPTACRP